MIKKRPIIIDTDPGIDDAIALAFTLFEKSLDVKLIATVSGNVGIDNVTNNALRLLSFFNKEVPVVKGATTPLLRRSKDAGDVHGTSGLAGFNYEYKNIDCLMDNNAVETMYNVLKESEEPVTILALGPLTNVALLLKAYPDSPKYIKEIILMGGAINRGNVGVYTEFNIGFDPEAAKIVFDSPIKTTMVGLEIGKQAVILSEDTNELKLYNKYGEAFYNMFMEYRSGWIHQGLEIFDATAAAYLIKPELFETKEAYVTVEISGQYTAGATVVDFDGFISKEKNTTVCTKINATEFRQWFKENIKRMD